MKQYEKDIKQMPEIQVMKGIWQNDFHEFDVYNHTMDFVRHIRKMTDDDNIIAAGYLHDIGKPVTAQPKVKNGIWLERSPTQKYHTFPNHEAVGEDMVRAMSPELFDTYNLNQDRVAKLVGVHYEPMKGIKQMRKATSKTDFIDAFENLEGIIEKSNLPKEEVWMMFLADTLSKGQTCTDQPELETVRDLALKGIHYAPKDEVENLYQQIQHTYHKEEKEK